MKYAALILALACSPAYCQPVYDSVCEVSNMFGDHGCGGSGTLVGVTEDGEGLILTCGHLWENEQTGQFNEIGNVTARFKGGDRLPCKVLGIDQQDDCSVIQCKAPPGIKTVHITDARAEDGPFIAIGYPAANGNRLSFSVGKYTDQRGGRLYTRLLVTSGYSGGAVVNKRGELCGVADGMSGAVAGNLNDCYGPSGTTVKKFISQWMITKDQCPSCGGGGCYGGGCPQQPRQQRPPQNTPIVGSPGTPQFNDGYTPGIATPVVPAQPQLSQDQVKGWIAAEFDKLPKPQDGKDGQDGQPGPPGPAGKDGTSPTLDYDAIATAVASKIKLPAQQTPAPTKPEQHVVVIADHNSSYYERIATAVKKAQDTYSGIEMALPPNFDIGEMPQAVVYENGIPVRVVKSQYQVEDLISRVGRGDTI